MIWREGDYAYGETCNLTVKYRRLGLFASLTDCVVIFAVYTLFCKMSKADLVSDAFYRSLHFQSGHYLPVEELSMLSSIVKHFVKSVLT